jgi:Tfp pilus assembly protein PilN
MKNRVNLYHPEFHPKLRLLTLSIVILIWLFTLLVCASVYFYESFKQQDVHSAITMIERDKQQQQRLVEELQNAIDNQQVDPKLLKQVESNQQIISLKKRVLNELAGQEGLKSSGFANLMLDLASQNQSGLWLTHINLDGVTVVMEGATTDSATVPKWLRSLGQTDYFRGQEFADTRLYRDSTQQLNFIISSGKELIVEKGANDE